MISFQPVGAGVTGDCVGMLVGEADGTVGLVLGLTVGVCDGLRQKKQISMTSRLIIAD